MNAEAAKLSACIRELPLKFYAHFKGAIGLHHHGKVNASYLEDTIKACIGHLKQHSTAIV